MSAPEMKHGHIVWSDLTVPDADGLKDFYASVLGWTAEAHDMEEYQDWSMLAPDGARVAGVCHARGVNADIPAVWMVYVIVPDVAQAVERCVERGGSLIDRRDHPGHQLAVLRDPAGAVFAVFEAPVEPAVDAAESVG